MKKLLSLIFALALFTGCQPAESPTPEDWTLIDLGEFTVEAPATWEYVPEQGTDSFVGRIEGDGVYLTFDYGAWSGFLDSGTEADYKIEEDSIDGFDAKIATPKATGDGLTVILFEQVPNENRLSLSAWDLNAEQEALALEVFQTIKFKQ